jgi:uncharacterized membrane protein YbhN (UPF0104 family)
MAALSFKNTLKLVIKLVVTGLCLWYVSQKIDWSLSWQLLQQSNGLWLLLATVLFAASKVVSAYRLNIYFNNIQVNLSQASNLRLYWLGMFYNLFLPGGIGGDAYKVILLNKQQRHPVKLLSAAVLLDRISGVTALGILAAFYFLLVDVGSIYAQLMAIGIIPGLILFYFLVKQFFPSFLKGFWSTLWLGLGVQLLQVFCVYALMLSISIDITTSAYILIFLVSSVVAILPFTIGGLGAREVVFLWGSAQFMLDKHESVYISILFYLITVAISLIGIRWVYKKPLD